MLEINIPAKEYFDEDKQEFVTIKEQTLELEHSLISVSKWEAKWHKPFHSQDEKTVEETLDYIKCMTINNRNVDSVVYNGITSADMQRINEYINDPMTATWFSEQQNKRFGREVITSELIYYWMSAFQIPFSCEKWHLNRLLTLIRVCNVKNQPEKKMSKRDIMNRNRALNEARKKKYNTSG